MFLSLVGDVPVVVDVFEVEWWAVRDKYNGAVQWCLGA